MMREIISLAKKSERKAIRLDALATNIPAQRLYEKLGFVYRGKQNLFAENTGKHLALDSLKQCTTTSRDVRHLVRQTELVYTSYRVTTTNE